MRLARGDFSVRLQRNFTRDPDDILALFVNLIAEELGRLMAERESEKKKLEAGVTELSELFLGLAAGDFTVRAKRTESGDPLDVLAFLLNNTAAEVGDAFREIDRQRIVLEAILESMVDGVLLLDEAGIVQRANGAFSRCLGYASNELSGQRIGALLARSEQGFASRLAGSVDAEPIRHVDVLFRAKSGESVPLTVNASPQRDPGGAVTGVVLVARDERELRQAQAQLQLSDRLATMGTLAAGVAHEINNPLAFIIGNLDFISEELEASETDPLDAERIEELRQALAASQGGAERVRQIVRDLKGFSRVDQDAIGPVDLAKLLDSASHMMRNEIRHRARLVRDVRPAPTVEANEARLLQVFLNLLQNAAHAIPSGHVEENSIRVVVDTDDDGNARVEIHDTGAGIAPSDLKHIFDAFFTTKPIGVGTGLGLSICHKIVTGLGGTIAVESEVGRGTMFRLTLPTQTARAASEPPPASLAVVPAGRKRILVVDDEPEVLRAIERILGRDHDLMTVASGREAVSRIEDEDWDLILCDLMMPEITGVQVYEEVTARSPALSSRIVFMTGGTFDPVIREFIERVPNGILDKPFDSHALRGLVARIRR